MKLVDTSSWIDYLRKLDSDAGRRVEKLVLEGDAAWCDMTLVELWHGTRGAREKRELGELEKEIALLPTNSNCWHVARKLALRCREEGLTVPASDIVIAATAKENQVEVEHCDSHFERILPIVAKL